MSPPRSAKPEFQEQFITSEIYGLGGTVKLTAIAQLLLQGRGPLASTGCDHGAFVNTRGERAAGARLASAHLWRALSFLDSPGVSSHLV